ncbi:MAG: fibronectin type III domain-containing protein [Maribacter sp.]
MRKTNVYLAISLGLLVVACSSKDSDGGPNPETNTAPSVPNQVFPLNNTLCIDNAVNFQWDSSTDLEGNPLTYKVELSENSSFTSLAFDETSITNSKVISLPKGNAYHWRVKAIDSELAESGYSSVSQFLTEGDGVSNHLPFSPDLIAPALDTEIDGTTTTLKWSASDADNDTLTYDVYLDTNSDPTTIVSENQTATAYTASNLIAGSSYYFKVAAKDSNGATTIGQVWNFKTK